jgi:hypothetical protein
MIVTMFYILSIAHVIRMNFDSTFNPVGAEFVNLVLLGFLALLHRK